jgi:flavin-dependent dehydrogenase
VDKAAFPRDKVCGDGLDTKVIQVLNAIDPELTKQMLADTGNFLPVMGVRFAGPGGEKVEVGFRQDPQDFPFPSLMFTSRRTAFDHFLTQQLPSDYADFRTGIELQSCIPVASGWELTLSDGQNDLMTRTRLLIGADGDHSTLLRNLSERKINRRYYAAGVRAYFQNVEGFHPGNYLELHFLRKVLPGYFWMFHLPDGEANVGLMVHSETVSRDKLKLRALLQEIIETEASIAPRFRNATPAGPVQGWGLPLSHKSKNISGDHYLLAGDAGALINPVSGEGIGTAMVSGRVAAKYAKQALKSGKFDSTSLKEYDREMHRRFAWETGVSDSLRRMCRYPWLIRLMMGTANLPPGQWLMRKALKDWSAMAWKPYQEENTQ